MPTMTNPMSRFASFAATASLALAVIVGVVDAAQVGSYATGTPQVVVPAFSLVTPAVGSLT